MKFARDNCVLRIAANDTLTITNYIYVRYVGSLRYVDVRPKFAEI